MQDAEDFSGFKTIGQHHNTISYGRTSLLLNINSFIMFFFLHFIGITAHYINSIDLQIWFLHLYQLEAKWDRTKITP